jgi:hypothetical protein
LEELAESPAGGPGRFRVDETVAAEIFYRQANRMIAFVGLRYCASLRLAGTPTGFVRTLVRLAPQILNSRLDDALALLGVELNDDPRTYRFDEPAHLELGVIDHWTTAGSLVIWRANTPKPTTTQLVGLAGRNKNLRRNPLNHVALEFAFGKPAHWLGVQVSDADGESFVLNVGRLARLVAL